MGVSVEGERWAGGALGGTGAAGPTAQPCLLRGEAGCAVHACITQEWGWRSSPDSITVP